MSLKEYEKMPDHLVTGDMYIILHPNRDIHSSYVVLTTFKEDKNYYVYSPSYNSFYYEYMGTGYRGYKILVITSC